MVSQIYRLRVFFLHALCFLCIGISPLQPASACLNEAEPIPTNAERARDTSTAAELRALLYPPTFDTEHYLSELERYRVEIEHHKTAGDEPQLLDATNRYALALVYTERYSEARDVWLAMEERNPGTYATAANLGTAYELTGDNANALKWIKAGIERNPDSHGGTEWLHVRILEAKLALAEDSRWLDRNHVTGEDFTSSAVKPRHYVGKTTGNRGQPLSLEEMRLGLTYQLKERLKFIRYPDPMVAQLLLDLGDALFLSNEPAAALEAYRRSADYGTPSVTLALRMETAERRATIAAGPLGWLRRYAVHTTLVLIVLLAGLAVASRRRRLAAGV